MRYEYPSLRQGLVFAACPSLGSVGSLAKDFSPYGNHASLAGTGVAPSVVLGKPALLCNGGTAASSRTLPLTGDVRTTIACWVRTDTTSFVAIGGFGNGGTAGIFYVFTQSNAIQISYNNVTQLGLGSFSLNQWFHVALTRVPGSQAKCFINGVDTNNTVGALTLNVVAGAFWFFSFLGGTSYRASNQAVDDVRVYNRDLTAAEIGLLASRRGIGLTPLPDRGGGLPRKLSVNVGGTWRSGDAYVNTGSGWRLGIPYVNVGGTFR